MAKLATCLHDIPLTKLRERVNARALREQSILGLMESIREVGVISPLRVRFKAAGESDVYEITAGRHRHEAARRLGLATVPCIIEADDDLHAEFAMIDENLMRAELSPADRAKQTARRKEIYEELHPEARHGGDRKSSGQLGHLISDRFGKEAAAATGKSERVVRRDAERGQQIDGRALDKVRGTSLDKGSYLDSLKAVPKEEQIAVVERDLAEAVKSKPDIARIEEGNTASHDLATLILGRFEDQELPTLIALLEAAKPKEVVAELRRARSVANYRKIQALTPPAPNVDQDDQWARGFAVEHVQGEAGDGWEGEI